MNEVNVITFGCRLNTFESEIIRKHIEDSGLKNVIVIHTCAVTSEAERQAKEAEYYRKIAERKKRIAEEKARQQAEKELRLEKERLEKERIRLEKEKARLEKVLEYEVRKSKK